MSEQTVTKDELYDELFENFHLYKETFKNILKCDENKLNDYLSDKYGYFEDVVIEDYLSKMNDTEINKILIETNTNLKLVS